MNSSPSFVVIDFGRIVEGQKIRLNLKPNAHSAPCKFVDSVEGHFVRTCPSLDHPGAGNSCIELNLSTCFSAEGKVIKKCAYVIQIDMADVIGIDLNPKSKSNV